jgi:hypothetical protein
MLNKAIATFTMMALITCFSGFAQPLRPSTTVTGTLVFNLTFTLKSNTPPNGALSCAATAVVNDTGSGAVITENAASLGSSDGTGAVCTVKINYSWNLASESTDKIALSYVASTNPSGTAFCGSSTEDCRTSQVQNFVSISVPANGTITTENIGVTL